jgi:hypothetical protein
VAASKCGFSSVVSSLWSIGLHQIFE